MENNVISVMLTWGWLIPCIISILGLFRMVAYKIELRSLGEYIRRIEAVYDRTIGNEESMRLGWENFMLIKRKGILVNTMKNSRIVLFEILIVVTTAIFMLTYARFK